PLLHREQRQSGRELLDLQRRQLQVGGGHASTSPGTRVTRFRRWGAKVFCATRCTSAAVIAAYRSGRSSIARQLPSRTSICPIVWARPLVVDSARSSWLRTRFLARSNSRSERSSRLIRESSAQSALSARAGSTPGLSLSEI